VAANLSVRKNLRHDVPAGLVVFLVALPLCLGIALASGAPMLSGLITGIIAGLIVSWLSGSPLSVSGPAAGLTVIVLGGIQELGLGAFLLATMIAGALQILLGVVRAGVVASYIPSTVIKGMLAAIGIILVLKQIPHAVGWDPDYEGDFFFFQPDGRNTLSEIPAAMEHLHLGACIIALVGLAILIGVGRAKRLNLPKWLPAPLLVVVAGIVLNELFRAFAPELANEGHLLVEMPKLRDLAEALHFPDFTAITNPGVIRLAVVLAIVASIETLLSTEAADRLDPFFRRSDADRELKAQGVGNLLAGLLGGIPMTAVIVRTSANIQAGGRTNMSAFVHGLLLLAAVLLIPSVLDRIPLSALAAVLLHVGYKLTQWQLFRRFYRLGRAQFLPFLITVLAIVFSDLLSGVAIGVAVAAFFILRANARTPFFMTMKQDAGGVRKRVTIKLSESVTFLNKAGVNAALHRLPDGAFVVIDASGVAWLDRDVLEIIHEFAASAHYRGIDVELLALPPADATAEELADRRPIVRHES
jgi:MFS superfamily sulfate permease-like transporter